MTPLVIHSTVGSDGTLRLTVPVGLDAADKQVRVTVEPAMKEMSQDEWRRRVLAMAGKWQGDFVRPDQGVEEQRDPMS
jgi:hypothetical protein